MPYLAIPSILCLASVGFTGGLVFFLLLKQFFLRPLGQFPPPLLAPLSAAARPTGDNAATQAPVRAKLEPGDLASKPVVLPYQGFSLVAAEVGGSG